MPDPGIETLYLRPTTLNEAVQNLAIHGGKILSGGTDFFPSLGERAPTGPVVDVSSIRDLRGVSIEQERVRIGGLTTWSEIVSTRLPRCFDALKEAAQQVGSIQIQNRGTVAGNLCNASPAADGIPPLLALDAEVELVSATGTRRMPLADFVVGNRKTERRPDEILANIYVPRDLDEAGSKFLKLGARRYLVISISMVAAIVRSDTSGKVSAARVAVGSCSARAQRLPEVERTLIGVTASPGFGETAVQTHLAPLSPIDDIRATTSYRMDASLTLIRRALEACVAHR
jgi:CO/xanthine dehydrogenase FAD-binding subunit